MFSRLYKSPWFVSAGFAVVAVFFMAVIPAGFLFAPFAGIFAGLAVASAVRESRGGEMLPPDLTWQQIEDEYKSGKL